MQLARRIGKVAVVSGVCDDFIGNRMAEVYMREAEFLILKGQPPAQMAPASGGITACGPRKVGSQALPPQQPRTHPGATSNRDQHS